MCDSLKYHCCAWAVVSSVFFPWRKDGAKNRRNSRCQEMFCQWAHHVLRMRQRHSYNPVRLKCTSTDLLCRSASASTSQVLSDVCFLMQLTASWKLYSATLFIPTISGFLVFTQFFPKFDKHKYQVHVSFEYIYYIKIIYII